MTPQNPAIILRPFEELLAAWRKDMKNLPNHSKWLMESMSAELSSTIRKVEAELSEPEEGM